MITTPVEDRLYGALVAKCAELGCLCLAVGGTEDHVHLLVRLAPQVAVSTLVGQLKGASSHLVNHEILGGGFRWQGSYGVFSVSKGSVAAVSEYVLGQKAHHRDGATLPAVERCQAE